MQADTMSQRASKPLEHCSSNNAHASESSTAGSHEGKNTVTHARHANRSTKGSRVRARMAPPKATDRTDNTSVGLLELGVTLVIVGTRYWYWICLFDT